MSSQRRSWSLILRERRGSKVANACKAKGDWCAKHKRARSQCFICEPALHEVFAAKYRAHYSGKEPPPIEND